MRWFALVVLCSIISVIFCEKARFDNYRVYLVKIDTQKQLEALQELEGSPDGLLFTAAPVIVYSYAEIIVPPHKLPEMEEFFKQHELESEIKNENLQR